MAPSFSHRRDFLSLTDGIFRKLGYPEPPIPHEPEKAVVLRLVHRGFEMAFVHEPEGPGDHVRIECTLQALSGEEDRDLLVDVLVAQFDALTAGRANLGWCVRRNALLCNRQLALEGLSVESVIENFDDLADGAQQWSARMENSDA